MRAQPNTPVISLRRLMFCMLFAAATAFELSAPLCLQAEATDITPKTVYVYKTKKQQFEAPGATHWSVTQGTITQAGNFSAPKKVAGTNQVVVTATGPLGTFTATAIVVTDGAMATISPIVTSMEPGQKQAFTSTGAKTWTAQYGTITADGVYTTPAMWPTSGSDTIAVNGLQGTATMTITLVAPVPAITGATGNLGLGPVQIAIKGTNFFPSSVAEICGAPMSTTYASGELTASGFCTQAGAANLTVTSGGISSKPYPLKIGLSTAKASPAAARRLLEQAAFGPSPADAQYLQSIGIPAWIDWQLSVPQVSNYLTVTAPYGGMPEQFMTNAVEQPDQLRQRVAFALSQIFVTSLAEEIPNASMVLYQDTLLKDAFGNYRQILSDVALSSAMGRYLNMANNAKANPSKGTLANENFAREMMQLFTIGTSLLNEDGSPRRDSYGNPLPTYTQFTVAEFARVYTGWTFAPAPGTTAHWNETLTNYGPMVAYPAQHDPGSKQLLNGYVSPAGISPQADLNNALDNIFSHSNVAPFISKQLIQHLVKSNPSSEYVARVAAVFNDNGMGVKGDLKAVVRSILLDPEARANDEGGEDQTTDGHLQEPALFLAGMLRAFGGQVTDQNSFRAFLTVMGQDIFSSPEVFNYYAPNFAVAGTNLEGGEFQIDSPNNAVLRANLVYSLFSSGSNPVENFHKGTTFDLTPFLGLAGDPAKLVDALDLTLTDGVMPDQMKQAVTASIAGETHGNLRRVERGIYLILTSSYYNVAH